MATTVDRIHLIWCWCCDAYLRIAGRRLSLQKDTDPTKTYQWRFLTALNKKFDEWEFDDALCKAFIDVAVRYAKRRHLLNKGLSIFLQGNLLQECHDELRAQDRKGEDILHILRRTKAWLVQQAVDHDGDIVAALTERCGIGAYPNIVRWYEGGQLPEIYLALSRSCGIVIARLARQHADERALLPKDYRLCLVQNSALSSPCAKFDIKNILQDDWRRSCLS